eukprot:gene28519-20386_t
MVPHIRAVRAASLLCAGVGAAPQWGWPGREFDRQFAALAACGRECWAGEAKGRKLMPAVWRVLARRGRRLGWARRGYHVILGGVAGRGGQLRVADHGDVTDHWAQGTQFHSILPRRRCPDFEYHSSWPPQESLRDTTAMLDSFGYTCFFL